MPNCSNNSNELPPLHVAVAYNDEALILLYLSSGHDINAKETLFGRTPLHIAASNDNIKVARMLLDYQANVDDTAYDNLTALHIAVSNRSDTMVALLLKYGVTINPKQNFHGKTPLYMAVEYSCIGIVRVLLAKGASVLQATLRNSTVLHVAVRIGDIDMVRLLLDYVPDDYMELRDNVENKTPIDLAAELKYFEIMELLIKKINKRQEMKSICNAHGVDKRHKLKRDLETVDLLLRDGKRIPLPKVILNPKKFVKRSCYSYIRARS